MALNGLVLKTGGTTTTAGGAAITFTQTGTVVQGGVEVANAANADYIERERIAAKVKMPTVIANGSWNKQKASLSITMPFIDTNGVTQYPLCRVELEIHPESTAADIAQLREYGAQALSSADLDAFFEAGSKA